MKLKNKIQNSMTLVVMTTLLVAYVITTFVVYRQTFTLMEAELRQEADYIKTAIDKTGEAYLKNMDDVRRETRVTLIDRNGKVLYDSGENALESDNHKDRPEIREARKKGSGQDVRESKTMKKEMFYYATKLPDGRILRVSKTMNSVFSTAMNILPLMGLIGLLMFVFAYFLSRWQVARLIHPINNLDLENPLDDAIYEELTPLLKRIDEQNKQKDLVAQMRKEFSANVSHELKTPLTSISGYAEIMKDGIVRPEDMKGFSERIYHEARRLITLVEDIIKLSKLDEGAVELEKEEVDLYALAEQIMSRLAPQAASRNVHMEISGEPVVFKGVRQVLDEMLYNVIENAIKYNKENGSVSIWAGSTLQGKKVIIRDTGIGIPKDQIERVFERFYRVDKSHSKETGGTGLGLSIVKHGALMHNIKIHVDSVEGVGTQMEFTFVEK